MNNLQNSIKAEVRWQLLALMDQRRPDVVPLAISRRALQSQGLDVTEAQLLRELDYLKEKGLCRLDDRQAWGLTAYGLEVLEGHEAQPTGIELAHVVAQSVRLRRQEIRWRILALADAARPIGVSRGLLMRALEDANLLLLENELAQETAYLTDKGLALWESEHLLAITADGVDVVAYDADAPAAVGRPPAHHRGVD